jgi:hypothetical protein
MHQALLLHRLRPEMPNRFGDRLAAVTNQQQFALPRLHPPPGPVAITNTSALPPPHFLHHADERHDAHEQADAE